MNETATGPQNDHEDKSQCYHGGVFVTACSCGETCEGMSPDDADAAHFEHVDEYQVPVDPMSELECDSCQ